MANGSGSFDALPTTQAARTRREGALRTASGGTFTEPMNPHMDEIVRRLVANPNDDGALGAAYSDGQRDPRGYATILERVGELTPDATYAAHWLAEAAQVWSTTLGDPRRAATLLMKAIERDPASDVASDRLAALYRDKGDHRALVALYERRAKALAAVARDDAALTHRLSVLHEDLGRLWQEPPLSQPRKAIENYRKAFEVDPTAVTAIYAARELLKAQGDLQQALPLYELEIRAIDDDGRKLALLRDEAALRGEAGDAKGASAALRSAHRLASDDTGLAYELAASIVARILAGEAVDPSERAEAATILIDLSESYDGEHGLAYAEAALDAEPGNDRAMQLAAHFAGGLGRSVDPRWSGYLAANPQGVLATDGRRRLAESYQRQGKLEAALQVLEPMRDDPELAELLGDLYAKAGKTKELAAHLDRHSASLPPAERLAKQLEIAELLAKKGDKKSALAKYREVLEVEPDHPEALAFVEDSLRAARQYKELRDVLLAAARSPGAPLDSRRAQLREVAALSEQLKDPDAAIAAFRQLLSIDRSDDAARAALRKLLEKGQRWDDLAGLLESEALVAIDDEERIVLEKKLAELHEQKRGDKIAAAEALLRAHGHAPKDDALLSRAIELLVAGGDLARAAEALDEGVFGLDPGPAKGTLLVRLGELRSQAGDHARAADAFSDAGALLHDAAIFARAEEAAVAAERFDLAAAAAGHRGDLARDPTTQAQLRVVEAQHLARAGDPSSAIERLEQAVDLAPLDDVFAEHLERAYEQEGRFEDLGAFLERRADDAADPQLAAARYKRAALFKRDRLLDPDGARALLLRVVEGGDDPEALALLADDAVAREDHAAALELLARIERTTEHRAEKIVAALRQASIQADRRSDVDAALAIYARVLELDDRCREALQAIADLQEGRQRYPEAADALERDLELAAPGEEKAAIARRLGEIYIEQTRELGKSLAAYEVVVREDPEDFAALQKLRELSERAAKWPRVVELLDAQIEVEGDDDEIAILTARRAEILADHLGRVDDALRSLAELAAAGSSVAREVAIGIADRHGADDAVAGMILSWARATGGAEGLRLLGMAFDRFLAAGAKDRALEIAADILRSPRGKDLAFLEGVEPLAVEARQVELVLEIHDRRAAIASGPARGEELVRQAEVRAALGIDPQEALEHGELGLATIPPADAEPFLDRLAAIATAPLAAIEIYERYVGRAKAPTDRAAAIVRAYGQAIARADGGALVVEKARELAEAALAISSEIDPIDALWSVADRIDREQGRVDHRRALVAVVAGSTAGPRDGGKTRAANLRRLADRVRSELDDPEGALELLTQSLIVHVDQAALDAVEEAAGDDPSRAEAILSRALEEVFDGPLVRQLLSRRATLREERLGDVDGALRDLKKLHELAPADAGITERYRALLTSANDYRGLIQLHEDQILRSKDQALRADHARAIARLWEERLGDAREAADAWRRVLRLKPQDPEATEGLDRAKRNKLNFDPEGHPPQRAVVEHSVPPPPKASTSSRPAPKSPAALLAESIATPEPAIPAAPTVPSEATIDFRSEETTIGFDDAESSIARPSVHNEATVDFGAASQGTITSMARIDFGSEATAPPTTDEDPPVAAQASDVAPTDEVPSFRGQSGAATFDPETSAEFLADDELEVVEDVDEGELEDSSYVDDGRGRDGELTKIGDEDATTDGERDR
jgi:tetratricopeptide (TPR) repeat protein